MKENIQLERARCVGICRSRAELWKRTAVKTPIATAREEARARANEAAYLADLLASGVDLSDVTVIEGDDADA